MTEIIYKELSYKLNGIFYSIYNVLGCIHSEKQYQDTVEIRFKQKDVKFEREKDLFFDFNDSKIGGNKVDFVAEAKIPIDIKAKRYITKKDFKQMLRYLKAGNYKLGLIVNFGSPNKVTIKRIVNSGFKTGFCI